MINTYYFSVFLLIVLFYVQYKNMSPIHDTFNTNLDLCQPFESTGKQCPYRVHYRECCKPKINIIPETNTQTNTQTNTENKCKSNKLKVIPSKKININCPMAFNKYPVCDMSTNNLLQYPWVARTP
jgi:hypothetical protein